MESEQLREMAMARLTTPVHSSPDELPDGLSSGDVILCRKFLRKFFRLSPLFFWLLLPAYASAQAEADDRPAARSSLADLSLEELLNVQVTSVSRRAESLSSAASSIYVITADDIRRSGATSLPEALRLAPNLHVARRDAYQYAITARGFNNAIGNKLLVLLDGRTVYTPLFSGVFWEMQDTMPEDIERIEVISGPGASLWGANAVNGVINIITRSSAETQDTFIGADAGNTERGLSFRIGSDLGERGSWRIWARARDWDNTTLVDGSAAQDSWRREQVGFRSDWSDDIQQFTLQGDHLRGESEHRGFAGSVEIPEVSVKETNLLARWTRQLDSDSSLRLQAYWVRSRRDEIVIFSPRSEIVDLEFQHAVSAGRQNLVWGGGVRRSHDEIRPGYFSVFIPDSRRLGWENVFVQNDISLGDQFIMTLGLKMEWNDFSGGEHLPTLRLAWNVAEDHFLWGALSRAVRAPSRYDREVYFPEEPPYIIAGGPDFQSEVAVVTELGYRAQPLDALTYSLTLFHHDWHKLRSGTPLPLPAYLANNIKGEAYGVEAWATLQPTDRWRLHAGISTLEKDLRFRAGTSDTVGVNNRTLHNDPSYQWTLRSSFDLGETVQMDMQLRHVASLPVEPVPAYTELDLWWSWQASPSLELSLRGRNLLNRRHSEFAVSSGRSEFRRSVLFSLRWVP